MVKFIEIDPSNIPTHREGRRGRVSYPLLKSFLESHFKCAKLDLTGFNKNPTYLRSVLYAYIGTHKLPIKIFSATGDLYLMRLDMDDDGNVDPDWSVEEKGTEGSAGDLRDVTPVPLTQAVVDERFKQEKDETLK